MTVTFIPGQFESASLHHDGDGNWSLVIHVKVELETGGVLWTHIKLSQAEVKRELLAKTMSLCEGIN